MAEVFDVTYGAFEDLADSLLVGRYLPYMGDYVIIKASGWYGCLVDPMFLWHTTTLEDAKDDVERMEYENSLEVVEINHAAEEYEIWHIVPDENDEWHVLTLVDPLTDAILEEEIYPHLRDLNQSAKERNLVVLHTRSGWGHVDHETVPMRYHYAYVHPLR